MPRYDATKKNDTEKNFCIKVADNTLSKTCSPLFWSNVLKPAKNKHTNKQKREILVEKILTSAKFWNSR